MTLITNPPGKPSGSTAPTAPTGPISYFPNPDGTYTPGTMVNGKFVASGGPMAATSTSLLSKSGASPSGLKTVGNTSPIQQIKNPQGGPSTGPDSTNQFDEQAWQAQMTAIQGLSGQMASAGDKFTGQYGSIDQSLSAQESNAQKTASTLARNEITTNNLMGASGTGGSAQAGAAQAALGGESLMNQAISQAAAQRIQVAQNQVQYMSHIADQQYDIAKTAFSSAKSSADQERANDAMLKASQSQAQLNALTSVLSSGANLDPATVASILAQIQTPGVPG